MSEIRPLAYHHDRGTERRIKAGGKTNFFGRRSFGTLMLKKVHRSWTLIGLGKIEIKKYQNRKRTLKGTNFMPDGL